LRKLSSFAVCLFIALMSPRLLAVPVTGELSFSGTIRLFTNIEDFLPFGPPDGAIVVSLPSTGTFAALPSTAGTIKDMDRGNAQIGVNLSLTNYLTFAANPTVRFDLTFLKPGIYDASAFSLPPATGQTASPFAGQFNCINTSPTSSIWSFSVLANAVNSATNETTPYEGLFTFQFANLSFQEAALIQHSPDPNLSSTFSAHFTPVVPEPLGIGATTSLLLLSLRRRSRRS